MLILGAFLFTTSLIAECGPAVPAGATTRGADSDPIQAIKPAPGDFQRSADVKKVLQKSLNACKGYILS